MPPIHLSDAQLAALSAFLLKLTPKNSKALESAPPYAVEGAMTYQANQCGTCHTVNGEGMKVGPSLNGLFKRRTKEWVEKQIRNPKSHSPDTIMPSYDLSPREIDQLVSYLFSLPHTKSISIAGIEMQRYLQGQDWWKPIEFSKEVLEGDLGDLTQPPDGSIGPSQEVP